MTTNIEHQRRAGIFEDNRVWFETIRRILEKEGFSVAFIATTLQAALEEIKNIKAYGGIDVVTLDGNLGDYDRYNKDRDARVILEELQDASPDIIIIGLSGDTLPVKKPENETPGVTVDVGKSSLKDLAPALQNLFPSNSP